MELRSAVGLDEVDWMRLRVKEALVWGSQVRAVAGVRLTDVARAVGVQVCRSPGVRGVLGAGWRVRA